MAFGHQTQYLFSILRRAEEKKITQMAPRTQYTYVNDKSSLIDSSQRLHAHYDSVYRPISTQLSHFCLNEYCAEWANNRHIEIHIMCVCVFVIQNIKWNAMTKDKTKTVKRSKILVCICYSLVSRFSLGLSALDLRNHSTLTQLF